MNGTELAKAYVQIVPSADGIKGKLTTALSGEASSAGNSAGRIAGNSLGSTIKTVIAAAGIGTSLKTALVEGADLQQSLGGIETLFKDSADKVKANAKNAYKTAGLSANEYMESVTSFSASLLQGLAGDTNKAADVADMALTDMSDNANKMGTSMELIQNAYQGFAKQNYTMLDNLKLGYGGTKSEMERMLADATKLSGVKYNLDNLSDVYEAIHVIQGELDITGTTSKEAASTLTGSFTSMKSAVSNVLGSLTLGEDIRPEMDALISSIGTFLFDNLFPMAGNILAGLVDYIVDTAMNTDWVSVITQALISIKKALSTGISTYFGADTTMINDMFGFIIDGIPVVAQTVRDAFEVLWDACGIAWTSIGQPIWDAILSIIQYVSDNFGDINGTLSSSFQELWDVCSTVWTTIGQPIWDMASCAIGSLAAIFSEHMPEILAFVRTAFEGMQDTWENHLKPMFEAVGAFLNDYVKPVFEYVWKNFILPLIENVFSIIGKLWTDTLKPVFDGICDFITGVFTGDWQKMGDGIMSIVTGLCDGIMAIFESIVGFLSDVWDNIKEDVQYCWDAVKLIVIGRITETKDSVLFVFTSIYDGIKEKIEAARDIVSAAIEKIKGFFDFEWSLPDLKIPHFSIQGSFSLNPPSVPSIGIEWYAKAMNNPVIMNSPMAFGINSLGQIMAGGEAGSEVVSGTDTLMKMIAASVASQNGALENSMNAGFTNLLTLLVQYLPQLANMKVVLNSGILVGELAPGIDEELGRLSVMSERGN